MTREEAIKGLKSLVKVRRKYGDMQTMKDEIECLDMAIKALEQEPCVVHIKDLSDDEIKKFVEIMKKVPVQVIPTEPCEDAISRQEVLNLPRKALKNYFGEVVGDVIYVRDVMELPPVTLHPKTGRWINGDPICPCCGENKFKDLDADVWSDWQPKFCPNCGAKMEV